MSFRPNVPENNKRISAVVLHICSKSRCMLMAIIICGYSHPICSLCLPVWAYMDLYDPSASLTYWHCVGATVNNYKTKSYNFLWFDDVIIFNNNNNNVKLS